MMPRSSGHINSTYRAVRGTHVPSFTSSGRTVADDESVFTMPAEQEHPHQAHNQSTIIRNLSLSYPTNDKQHCLFKSSMFSYTLEFHPAMLAVNCLNKRRKRAWEITKKLCKKESVALVGIESTPLDYPDPKLAY